MAETTVPEFWTGMTAPAESHIPEFWTGMFAAAEAMAPEGFQLDVEISMLSGEMPRVDTGPGHLIEEIQEYHDVEEPPAPVPAARLA